MMELFYICTFQCSSQQPHMPVNGQYDQKLIFFFLAALGLHCCVPAFSNCSKWGLLFVVVRGLLTAVVSLVVEHGLQAHGLQQCGTQALEHRLSSCGARAWLLRGMWDLPGQGIELVSPALGGRILTTVPPGKSPETNF